MKRIDIYKFKDMVKSQLDTSTSIITKDAVNKVEVIDKRRLKFKISTEAIDRHNDKIFLSAWDNIDSYMKNPVILWSHNDTEPPIAKCVDIFKNKSALFGVAEFVDKDMPVIGEFAEMVYRMCQQGFIQATSVGFLASEFNESDDEKRGAGTQYPGYDYHKADLMEFSLVSVPANPEALLTNKFDLTITKSRTLLNTTSRRIRQLEILGLDQ